MKKLKELYDDYPTTCTVFIVVVLILAATIVVAVGKLAP